MRTLIQQIPLQNHLKIDGGKYNRTIESKQHYGNYARIELDSPGVSYLTWIEGKGSGNILMCGVLQQMIALECNHLITQVSPRDSTSMEELIRFYEQFGLRSNKSLSSKYGRTMYSGNPFEYSKLIEFIGRVQSIIAK